MGIFKKPKFNFPWTVMDVKNLNDLVNTISELTSIVAKFENNYTGVPSGMVMYYPVDYVPDGWLRCNGQAVSRTTYAALFSRMGTYFGPGDGSTTFNLPELRGEFIRGWDDGRGLDIGRIIGTWQEDEIRSHEHSIDNLYRDYSGGGTENFGAAYNASGVTGNQYTTTNYGGNETRPHNVAMLALIKI